MTEVDKELPDCNFDEHYGYTKKLQPPAPASGGHSSRIPDIGVLILTRCYHLIYSVVVKYSHTIYTMSLS